MRVGFYTAFSRDPIHYALARGMLRSVREAMPGVPVVQFTNDISPAVLGVDEVRRLPDEPLCLITARHYSQAEGEWLLIDTDVLVQRDVRPVFEGAPWDLAVADREGTLVEGEAPYNPWTGGYNIGVVYQRNGRAFWQDVVEGLLKSEPRIRHWMGNQIIACKLITEGKHNVGILPGRIYNYPPKTAADDYSHAAVVHFKGPKRKQWLWDKLSEGRCAFA